MHRPFSRLRLLTGSLALLLTAAAVLLTPAVPAAGKAEPGCPAGGVKVQSGASPATVTVNDTTTGAGVPVVVDITGTHFTITPQTGTLDNAAWCLKASTKTQTGTGTTGTSTIKNKHGVPQDISYLVIYTVTTASDRPACWENSLDGISDFQYNGPINTAENGLFTNSDDGTCTGGGLATATVVQAPDQSAASALCQSLPIGLPDAEKLQNSFPAAPADYWACI
jgi:hypothetical protein